MGKITKRPDSTDSNSTTAPLQIRNEIEAKLCDEQASTTGAISLLINDDKKIDFSENSSSSKNKSSQAKQTILNISCISYNNSMANAKADDPNYKENEDKMDQSSKKKLQDYSHQNVDDLNLQTPKEYDSLLSDQNKRNIFIFELESESPQKNEDTKFSVHEGAGEEYVLYHDENKKEEEEIDYEGKKLLINEENDDRIKPEIDLDVNSPKAGNVKISFGPTQINQHQKS